MKNKVLLISLAVMLALSVGIVGCTAPAEEEEEDGNGNGNGNGLLDHFKCYWAGDAEPVEEPIGEVYLEDQFGAANAMVEGTGSFCNPVEKRHDGVLTPISNPNHHFTLYVINYQREPQTWQVTVNNQFGTQHLNVTGPYWLAVPTTKEGHEPPEGLDHFLLYGIIQGPDVEPIGEEVYLEDQFGDEQVLVTMPNYFANPVQKTHDGHVTPIQNAEAHLVFYMIEGGSFSAQVQVDNQFGEQTLNVSNPRLLAVPSEKISVIPPPDHFKCYWAHDISREPITEVVYLEDQFGASKAKEEYAEFFCNPVEKWHDGALTPISYPDHHLTVYMLWLQEEPETWKWLVEVDNQFGTQQLTVWGVPFLLGVPTRKVEPGDHEQPVGLDHFLLYEVLEGSDVDVFVDLNDQFGLDPAVLVMDPVYFANPVRKTDTGGIVTEIENPDVHLVFYRIEAGVHSPPQLQIVNQFGEQTLEADFPFYLAVPSEKLYCEAVIP